MNPLNEPIEENPEIKDIKNYKGDTIWYYLANSENYESLKRAIEDFNIPLTLFNRKIIYELRTLGLFEKTQIDKFIEKHNLQNKISDLEDNEQIDTKFLCPISRALMKDPVVNEYGICYDRLNIEHWLSNNNTDPFTNQALNSKILCACKYIENDIISFLESISK